MTEHKKAPAPVKADALEVERASAHTTAPDPTTTDQRAELAMFEWRQCPEHPVLAVSVIVTRGSAPWCVGGADVAGHWLDEQGAAR